MTAAVHVETRLKNWPDVGGRDRHHPVNVQPLKDIPFACAPKMGA